MTTFHFGLQKVLELREREEKEQARALADAEGRAADARRRLEEIRAIRDEEADKLMSSHTAARSVGQIHNLRRVVEQLGERVSQAEAAYAEASQAVESSRQELVEAMTQRRVMDQLKDRKRDAWRLALQGAERSRMDEVALGMYQRKAEENR